MSSAVRDGAAAATEVPPAPPARAEVRAALVTGGLLAAAGIPLGAIWSVLVPHVAVGEAAVAAGQQSYLITLKEEDLASPAGDLVLVAVLAVAGLLAGLLAVRFGRRTVAGTVVGLVVGGLGGGYVAAAIGHLLVAGDYTHALQPMISQVRPYVRGRVDAAVLPVIAVVVLLFGQIGALRRDAAWRRAEALRLADDIADSGPPSSWGTGTPGSDPGPARPTSP